MLVATWNVNSLNVRLPHVIDWLAKTNPDILCLQETKLTDDKFPHQAFTEAGYHSYCYGQKTYNGVAILSKASSNKIGKGFHDDSELEEKRLIAAKFDKFIVICVYIPNGQEVGSEKFKYKISWITKLKKYLADNYSPEDHLVICGDFNIAPEDIDVYDPIALQDQILFSSQEKEALESLSQWGFVDTFRMHNKESGLFSWWDYRMMAFRRKMGLRIDHIWATKSLAKECTASWIDVEPRLLERPSDHAPVIAEFKF